ncbi:MAG: tRNA (adenosine(37)-N6)-threonylcarbamoyltransferase complex transferase subunit TsaD, partial [Ferrovibrionaceae bacterium]
HHPGGRHLVVAGGVAANRAIGRRLEALTAARGISTILPPRQLCTDNAAMIAWAGLERARAGLIDPGPAAARARWPLDPGAEPKPYAGVKA